MGKIKLSKDEAPSKLILKKNFFICLVPVIVIYSLIPISKGEFCSE